MNLSMVIKLSHIFTVIPNHLYSHSPFLFFYFPSLLPTCFLDSKDLSYYFGCETKLNAANVPRLEIVVDSTSLGNSAESKALVMLRTLLAQQGRCLTPAQWEFVAPRLAEEPTALYVRLALRTVGERMNRLAV